MLLTTKQLFKASTQFEESSRRFREKGPSLKESGYPDKYVIIYRAASGATNHFYPMDFITLSRKFAIGHAKHNTVIEEEPQNVLRAMVKAEDVFKAPNPGEYFYDGLEIKGVIILTTSVEDEI